MKRYFQIGCLSLLIVLAAIPTLGADTTDAINPEAILADANLENGKAVYDVGTPIDGAHLSFNGGPHWLRSQGGGCGTCHGSDGLGNIEPDFCFLVTPPITYKFLAGEGYPFSSRQDGSHPAYTAKNLQRVIETGFKPNGYELDYCMPRWRISDDGFRDLLGYLIMLDRKK